MQAGYFQTAWSDIKNSPNWFGKLCLLALVGIIPIFGQIVAAGYAYGWARDIAWNIHAPMPERIFGNEDGKLYSRGFFALVVSLVFGIPAALFYAGYAGAHSGGSMGFAAALLGLLYLAFALAGTVCAWVGTMRMSIYGRLSPGFQIKQIWKMIQHDTNGIGRILGMVVLVGLIIGLVASFVLMLVLLVGGAGLFVQLAGMGMGVDFEFDIENFVYNPSNLASLVPTLGLLSILLLVAGFFMAVAGMFLNVLTARALGYWTRQFDVPSWGGQDDPLPFEARAAGSAATGYGPAGHGTESYGTESYGAGEGYTAQSQAARPQASQAPQAQGQAQASYARPYEAAQSQPQQAPSSYTSPTQAAAPAWIEQANATAPQPQADPYSSTPAAQPFSDAPDVTTPFADASTPASADAFGHASPSAPDEAPASHTPMTSQADATPAQDRPSSDMHHKLEAKPAPRWQKIDLNKLD